MKPTTIPVRCSILGAIYHFDELQRQHDAASREGDHHRDESKRLDVLACRLGEEADALERGIARMVIDASGEPIPDIDAWHSATRPIWSVRVGGKLLCCVKNGHHPEDIDEAVDSVKLAIIDLDEIGGGS